MNAIDFLENERKKKINSRSNADAGEHSKTVGKHPNKPAKKEASEGYPRNQGTITLDEVLYREFKKKKTQSGKGSILIPNPDYEYDANKDNKKVIKNNHAALKRYLRQEADKINQQDY